MIPPADPDRALALGYAPPDARAALALLWRLDERLGRVVAATREAGIGRIRLAWWREALDALDRAAPPAEPLLAEVAAVLLPAGLTGAALGALADGWAALLDEPLDAGVIAEFGRERGGALFTLAARLCGAEAAEVAAAGAGWAQADLARHLSDVGPAALARAAAKDSLSGLRLRGWPRRLRALSILARLARDDAGGGAALPGSRRRALRVLRYGLG